MWEKIRVIFTIPELRRKILLTLLLLGIYRVGYQLTLPIVDSAQIKKVFENNDFLSQVATFSASRLEGATIFGLGIMPYISASIIFQLLGSVYPPLEKLQKEGESGRKKINEYTRYATVFLCIIQSWMYLGYLISQRLIYPEYAPGGHLDFFSQLTLVMVMTSGTVFLMWLGEQIDEYGIGNGISLLIMAGILARMPYAFTDIFAQLKKSNFGLGAGKGQIGVETVAVLAILFVAVIAGVIFMTQGQRRIPTQTAKHVRGRRAFGGQRQYLPLRINQAGVMPIIFASSLLLFPSVLLKWISSSCPPGTTWNIFGGAWGIGDFWYNLEQAFHRENSFTYNILYVALIYFFCYFWTAITFNPKDMADNLKNYGTFIPGYRPGRRTADYLEKVMIRITYVGAGFLSVVAIMPTLIMSWLPEVSSNLTSFYGGTSLLIAVSVAFDLVQKIDSHLVMRNYKGLLEK
jgi:preprotein translocase subunit SecY